MKILIFGLGSIGKKHVKVIQAIKPSAQIFAFRSNQKSEELDKVINIYSFSEVEKLQPDMAIISNPTSEHRSTINSLLKYKIPLFIEKPLSLSLDMEDIIKQTNKEDIKTYVACNLRFLDCLNYVKEHLDKKEHKINEVNVYCGSYLPEWRKDDDFRKSYSTDESKGGGAHLDLIHELDYLYWLLGEPIDTNRYLKSQSSLAISSIDYANYLLQYKGFTANVILNYYRRNAKRSLEIVFENETWTIDLLSNKVLCNDQVLFSSEQQIADTYQTQLKYFIDNLSKKQELFNTITDGYKVLKICLGE